MLRLTWCGHNKHKVDSGTIYTFYFRQICLIEILTSLRVMAKDGGQGE